jgi:hypothetical protein
MTEETKKSGKSLLILAVIFIILGLITLIPYANIDDACYLGYKALCAFTPISTLILFIAAVFFLFLRNMKRVNVK